MSSSIGNILKITIFGESHGYGVGLVIDGIPAGTIIDEQLIENELKNRKTNDSLSTYRSEKDEVTFISGVFNGKATGSPISFFIKNTDANSKTYTEGEIRPSHSDLVSYLKYQGFNDYRGGGFSSGRITASLIVLGTICKELLKKYNVKIGTHIKSLGGIKDRPFEDAEKDIEFLSNEVFPVLDQDAKKEFINKIEKARSEGDSIGGELETMIINVPSCLGEPYFCSIESYLSQLIFSVGGVKGIAFGNYEDMISKTGSQVNDQLKFEDGKIVFKTNNAGGINGGISNGQNIYFTTIVKPTSSIAKTQNSINIKTKENIDLSISGRHDPCILHRVRPVIDSLVAYALVDLLMMNESKKI